MMRRTPLTGALRPLLTAVCLATLSGGIAGEADSVRDLRREVDELRRSIAARGQQGEAAGKAVDAALARRGPESVPVSTKQGRLQIGGLLQVWGYSIQNDHRTVVDLDQVVIDAQPRAGISNELADNDSFRVRRAQVNFTLDISPHITSVVMMDFARETPCFPFFPSNQASAEGGATYILSCFCGEESTPAAVTPATCPGRPNRVLQDAYILYHDFVPHHDFRVGQFRRRLGEEGSRDDGALDFAERAMIAQLADFRDLGLQAHGAWLDSRLEYWLGAFDGAGTAFQQRSNRSDDNDRKDVAATVRVLPVRNHDAWGTLEAGYSIMNGIGGEAGSHTPGTNPINGLNRRETTHSLQYAWLGYFPGGPVRGWWLRGEWGQHRDRFAPGESASGLDVTSTDPAPFNVSGWNFSTGYRLDQSACRERLHGWLKPVEFAFRYDVMESIFFHDLVYPERRFDVFKTQVYTAGVNYRVSSNAKAQLNYNWVIEEDDRDKEDRQLRKVRNNTLLLNLQVSF